MSQREMFTQLFLQELRYLGGSWEMKYFSRSFEFKATQTKT